MAVEMWDCPCGRRVPGHVETCRCGRARLAAPEPRAHAPLPVSAVSTSIYQSTGLRAVGAFGVMILVFFGSRACNREVVSRDVRQQAEEVLTRSMGAENAKTAMNRFHRACFDETYRTGWGRRQSSKFDEEKYVTCLADYVKRDRRLASSSGPPPERPGSEPSAPLPQRAVPHAVELSRPRLRGFERGLKGYVMTVSVTGPLPQSRWFFDRVLCDGDPVDGAFRMAAYVQTGVFAKDPSLVPFQSDAGCPADCFSCSIEVAVGDDKAVLLSDTIVVKLY